MAAAADDLYRAQTTVTGQGEANRIIGFAACLEDVLIKVSGAEKLAGDPRLAEYKSRAGDFVKAYSYHDQMSGTPTRDEQGTRDRPYDLIVDFDERKSTAFLGRSASSRGFRIVRSLPSLSRWSRAQKTNRDIDAAQSFCAARSAARRSRQAGNDHCVAERCGIGERRASMPPRL